MLAIICFLLIAGIIFFQGVQGLFSALIMALCTLAATLVAFTYYEPLAGLLVERVDAVFVEPVCLVLLTFVPLVVLRFLVDKYLPGNVVPTVWMDRIGGGAFGLVTALLLVGTLSIAVQMLPWGRGVAGFTASSGYDAFGDTLARKSSFLVDTPTSFTLGTVKAMSSSSGLRGGQSFATLHDDLVLEMWAARNRDESGGKPASKTWRNDEIKIPVVARSPVKPGCLTVEKVVDATKQAVVGGGSFGTRAAAWPLDLASAEGRSHVFVARVSVTRDAADADRWWRLRATNFRLVTKDGSSYYPVGYLLRKGGWSIVDDPNGIGLLEINRPAEKESTLTLDWVYRIPNLPTDQPRVPWFMAFRRIAKAPIAQVAEGMIEGGGLQQNVVVGSVTVRPPADSAKGGFILQSQKAEVMSELPVQFSWASREGEMDKGADREKIQGHLKGGSLADGVITGRPDELFKLSGGTRVTEFYQPSGKRVMRLMCQPPSSSAVQGFRNVAQVVFAPTVSTQEGQTYPAVGGWVKWKDGAAEVNYMSFRPDPMANAAGMDTTGLMGGGGGPLAEFLKIVNANVNQLGDCGLLFLVPENATIVSFSFAEGTPPSMCDSPMKVSQ